MAYCPSCMKMVSYGEPEVEVEDEGVEEEAVHVEVTVTIPCECGEPLRETSLEWEGEVEHDCPNADKEVEEEYELLSVDADGSERTEAVMGKKGQPTKKQNRFYGARLSIHVKCNRCGDEDIHLAGLVEQPAGSFDNLVG